MRQINNAEVSQVYLRLLEELDKLCQTHGLRYTLFCGTMLGAIRHKGFIPWDDDLDVAMPREDFEKLISLIPSLENERYHPICHRTHPELMSKICYMADMHSQVTYSYEKEAKAIDHIHIDIYPLDYIPNDEVKVEKIVKAQLRRIWWFNLRNIHVNYPRGSKLKTAIYKIVKSCVSVLNVHKILDSIDMGAKRYSLDKTVDHSDDLVYVLAIEDPMVPFPAKYLQEYVTVEFEHLQAKCLANYHEVLTALYGDYMQLPPEDKRKPGGNPYRSFFVEE